MHSLSDMSREELERLGLSIEELEDGGGKVLPFVRPEASDYSESELGRRISNIKRSVRTIAYLVGELKKERRDARP